MHVAVSDVRLLRPSTRLVLAMNSMDVDRREGARGVIDTAARYTATGRAWDVRNVRSVLKRVLDTQCDARV